MAQNLQAFPFGTAAPFRNGDPYLGGQIVVIAAAASAQPNALFVHRLKRLPHAFFVLDIGAQTAFPTPFSRGTTAWSQAQFSLALPVLSVPVTGVLL